MSEDAAIDYGVIATAILHGKLGTTTGEPKQEIPDRKVLVTKARKRRQPKPAARHQVFALHIDPKLTVTERSRKYVEFVQASYPKLVEEYQNPIDTVEEIEAGDLKGSILEDLRRLLGISQNQMSSLLGVDPKTYKNATRSRLKPDIADKAYNIAKIYAHAYDVFEDASYAGEWLREQSEALGGKRPLELMKYQTGRQIVENELVAIDYGMPV